nr:MAG TPA: hypothetical protein [Caudoviricetes sp.]
MLNDYRLRALGPSGWGNPQSFKTAETGGWECVKLKNV